MIILDNYLDDPEDDIDSYDGRIGRILVNDLLHAEHSIFPNRPIFRASRVEPAGRGEPIGALLKLQPIFVY